jgi:hypothetical protein
MEKRDTIATSAAHPPHLYVSRTHWIRLAWNKLSNSAGSWRQTVGSPTVGHRLPFRSVFASLAVSEGLLVRRQYSHAIRKACWRMLASRTAGILMPVSQPRNSLTLAASYLYQFRGRPTPKIFGARVVGFRDSLGEFAARPKRISEPPPEWFAGALSEVHDRMLRRWCADFGKRALVRLAVWVVLWHTCNLVGFGAIDLEACHSKYQGRCRQAETFGFERETVDLSCKALTSAEKCH